MVSLSLARAATRLRRYWARASSPPVFVARSRLPTTANAARIHAFTRRQVLGQRRGASRLRRWLEWAIWFVRAPTRVLVNTLRDGPTIRKRTGKGLWQQASEQLAMAWLGSIPPKSYYRFRLYAPEQAAQAGDYLHRFETKASLYHFLEREAGGRERLQEKVAFAQDCQRHGIRTVPVLMEFRDGRALPVEADSLPPRDLIVKPRRGRGGRQVVRWHHRADDRYESSAGVVLDRDALVRRLSERSRSQPCLVQPRLMNHPDLADLGRGRLTTVRMITCTNEAGDGEVTNASFRLGGADPVVDNMHRGGIAAAVDLRSGRLGPAVGLGPTAEWLVKQPDTGAAIAGRLLPWWPEALELACRAHRAFSACVVIGWDMALLEDGPCLVEGNRSPCVNLIQVPLGAPLGSARFGELVVHRIAEIEAEQGSRA